MSYSFDGASDRLTGSFTSTYSGAVTLAAFIKVVGHPLASDCVSNFGNSSSTVNDSHYIGTATTANDDEWTARSVNSGGTGGPAIVTLNIDGVWAGLVGVFTSATSRDLYVQALANTDNDATNITVGSALQHMKIGSNLANNLAFTGNIAECAVWNAALTSQQITDYMSGIAASAIASASLIGYWPMSASNATQANEGLDAGGDLSVTGATFDADHPVITLPSTARGRMLLTGIG